jgi:hypothetical protein
VGDSREGALPVAEPEAAARRDGIELSVSQLADPREPVARTGFGAPTAVYPTLRR